MSNKPLAILAVVLGIIFLIMTVVYATHTADMLPHYFPGYDATMTTKHVKHALGSGILAILAFVWAWFQSGPKKESANQ